MTSSFERGDKIWVKAVFGGGPDHDGEVRVTIRIKGVPAERTTWAPVEDIRRRSARRSHASDAALLVGIRRVLMAIAVAAGMQAARDAGVRHGRGVALGWVRDELGTVRYVASRIVHEVVDALQWDVTEAIRAHVPAAPEMDAVRYLQTALHKLDRDWMDHRFDASLSLADVLGVAK